MTNPIAKAVAKVAVNMGYGKASDYKGCTIKEVLATMFIKMGYGKRSDYDGDLTDVLYGAAKIAKEKGGPGGASSVLDDLIEGKEGIHLVSNAESVGDAAFTYLEQGSLNFGLGRYLESVDLPNATSIGVAAFGNCSALTSINLPNATSIGKYAFRDCSALTSINLPNVTSIGVNAFDNISPTAVINIGAAEGEIGHAPWGAPEGVTINYNVK